MTASSEERGTIYTFYSFKGGVGRSMALANVAALLAKWGHSVLVVDWDLEAPGIECFFSRDNPTIGETRESKAGMIDLIEAKASGSVLDWKECLIDVKVGSNGARFSLLTAGLGGEGYTTRLHVLDFPELFKRRDLGEYIEELRDQWKVAFRFVLATAGPT